MGRKNAPQKLSEEGRNLLRELRWPQGHENKYLNQFQLQHRPHLAAPESAYDGCTLIRMQDHPILNRHRL
ncbi:hypothetical protein [Aestuariispira insulae]|uniref:Uncharacterized protein n=1 Tax=Aestuariispira insulae TaxID=1461337 RepID=A0A3D9HXS1_9PROT|nr:hypothetical protein [Aestuariispira insulae]RED54294.1 hypothetical protein DFP90_1011097 [Aestuariispira insulae]